MVNDIQTASISETIRKNKYGTGLVQEPDNFHRKRKRSILHDHGIKVSLDFSDDVHFI